jgi:hypothetical protein
MDKQPYTQPRLETIGAIADFTRTGITNPGGDGKTGSAASKGQ